MNVPPTLPPLSTNAPYLLAVWSEVVAALPVQGICRTFHLSNKKVAKTTQSVKVDVVADDGRRWIRVNT